MDHTLPLEVDQKDLGELLDKDDGHLDGRHHDTIVLRTKHGGNVATSMHTNARQRERKGREGRLDVNDCILNKSLEEIPIWTYQETETSLKTSVRTTGL